MIRAVIFDLDNVLYDSAGQVEAARRAAISAMCAQGLCLDLDDAYSRLCQIVSKEGPNSPVHFNELVKSYSSGDASKLIASGVCAYHEKKRELLIPYPDAIDAIKNLRLKDYKLGIISNGAPIKQWEKLIRMGIEKDFDAVVISGEVGLAKPDPDIFHEAARRLKLNAKECAYVGDRPDTDIKGANSAGMKSIRLLRGKYEQVVPKNDDGRAFFDINDLRVIAEILEDC